MHAPTLPKLKKTPKRILDLVHLLFASLWLGGFTIVFVCSIMLWTQTIDPVFGLATINFVQEVVKVCIPALMATGLLYGFATKWGFFSHGWVTGKMGAHYCACRLNCTRPHPSALLERDRGGHDRTLCSFDLQAPQESSKSAAARIVTRKGTE